MVTMFMTTNTTALSPMPENMGRPQMPWATPMVKGFVMAPA